MKWVDLCLRCHRDAGTHARPQHRGRGGGSIFAAGRG